MVCQPKGSGFDSRCGHVKKYKELTIHEKQNHELYCGYLRKATLLGLGPGGTGRGSTGMHGSLVKFCPLLVLADKKFY